LRKPKAAIFTRRLQDGALRLTYAADDAFIPRRKKMARKEWVLGLGTAAAAAMALLAAPAHAGGASIHLNIGTPGYYYPQPYVYSQPSYVYTQPAYGYVYTQPSYVYTRPGHVYYGQQRYRRGGRDFDRDGIPNRFDRDRDNDGRPNYRDRDRDGDGVPNRYDRRPDNPYRR
jgi:hypothetical protein